MLIFDQQVVLITGAGRGIGRQHALFLASRGAIVIVNDYGGDLRGDDGDNPLPAQSVVDEITASGGTAMAACCDIGDAGQVGRMVDAAISRFGRIDAMIHNASVYAQLGPFEEVRREDLERIMRVNVTGAWNVAHAVWPHMQARGFGRIVMTGSGAGFFGRRRDQAYSVAKSALMGFAKLLATEGETQGIKVNLVGPVAFTENSSKQGIPQVMEKFAPPIQVSNLVALLVHPDCPVNGEMFHCGAGFVARVFIGVTQGKAYTLNAMSPEAVLADLEQIMHEQGYIVPRNSDRAGAHLSAQVASANPEFAKVLAAAKRDRKSGS